MWTTVHFSVSTDIHPSATRFKPPTGEVNNMYDLVNVRCSAGKPTVTGADPVTPIVTTAH